jgi:hypothetical protein
MGSPSYHFRVRQRNFYFRAGMILAGLGFISFASLMVVGRLEYIKFAMFLVGSGGILAMVCSRIGWSQTFLIDLLLNQVSVQLFC